MGARRWGMRCARGTGRGLERTEREQGSNGKGRPRPSGQTRTGSAQGGSQADPDPFGRYLLEVPVDRMQVVLEVSDEGLLPALQRLLVLHAILQAVEHPAHAGAQRLDGTNSVGEGLQVHSDTEHVRHVFAAAAGSPKPASQAKSRAR